MTEKMTIIRDLNSLRDWRAEVSRNYLPSNVAPPQFDISTLTRSGNARFTREAARLHRACGCAAGGLAMTMAVLLSALSVALDPRGIAGVPLLDWAGYLLAVAFAAAAGKLAGLRWARRQRLRLAASVEALIGRQVRRPAL